MNIPTTPAVQAIFSVKAFWASLQDFAPLSPLSGQKLTLVDYTPRDGMGTEIKIVGARAAGWENCMEKDWWHGSDRADYTRQVRRPVSPNEVAQAALTLNLLTVELGRELETWTAEIKADMAAREAAAAESHRKAMNVQRQLDWEAAIKSDAAFRANREFPGRENKAARNARRTEIEAQLFATSTRPVAR